MNDSEEYLLLILADSNLPTGSFVASSGLESYIKHGFAALSESAVLSFVQDSLLSYAHSSLPFVSDAYERVARFLDGLNDVVDGQVTKKYLDEALSSLVTIDKLYDQMTLNHVARRASQSQGVALLTLFSKGFSRPNVSALNTLSSPLDDAKTALVDRFKLMIRREETSGHLPTCWGVLTAGLSLSLERAQYLHLFLHCRALLSASVRLNAIGPYNAQQILLHLIKPLVAAALEQCKDLRTPIFSTPDFDMARHGPATTWPLGEILTTRHDLQHSRIFNS
ncbi:urease accessory protein UreF [Fistulina hepatica ATCC 64428]|nr:urease accessory protein UreF [Fistulina hepatica ATCC 64428]